MSEYVITLSNTSLSKKQIRDLLLTQDPHAVVTDIVPTSAPYPICLMVDGDFIDAVDVHGLTEENAREAALVIFKSGAPYLIEDPEDPSKVRILTADEITLDMVQVDKEKF